MYRRCSSSYLCVVNKLNLNRLVALERVLIPRKYTSITLINNQIAKSSNKYYQFQEMSDHLAQG